VATLPSIGLAPVTSLLLEVKQHVNKCWVLGNATTEELPLYLWIKPIAIFLDFSVRSDLLHNFGFEILTWDSKMGDPVMITDSSYSKWANVRFFHQLELFM
jgi:hypothetical protein